MIAVDLKVYCNDCPHFEPVASKLYANDSSCYMAIECENKRKCDNIELYLRCEMKKEDHGQSENVN